MTALVGAGDRIILPSGRESRLSRPSTPFTGGAAGGWGAQGAVLTNGQTVSHRQIAVQQPWVAVAVNGIARQISRLPLKVHRREDDGSRTRDRESEGARRLQRPGLRRTAADLKYAIACGLLIDGNHLEEKVTLPDGWPGLRALDWRYVTPYVFQGEVIAWGYAEPMAQERLIDVDDAVHFRWAGYADGGPLGVSPLQHLGVTLRTEYAAQQWGESNFRNGTRLGLAILMDKTKSADQLKREGLRDEIEARYSGPENSGRPLILGGGVEDVKSIGAQTPVEAALIEQRKVNRTEVLAVYNYPPPIAGDLEHGTFSNVAELAKILGRLILPPWTGLIGETLSSQVLEAKDPSAHYAEFDFNDFMRADLVQRMAAYRTATTNGFLTINEVREYENAERFAEQLADEPLVQGNNTRPLAQLLQKATDDKPAPGQVPEGGDVVDPDNAPGKPAADDAENAPDPERED